MDFVLSYEEDGNPGVVYFRSTEFTAAVLAEALKPEDGYTNVSLVCSEVTSRPVTKKPAKPLN
jgi:hypothetical protein